MVSADSQYTCFSNLDAIQNAEDLYNTGTSIRLIDQETNNLEIITSVVDYGYSNNIEGLEKR